MQFLSTRIGVDSACICFDSVIHPAVRPTIAARSRRTQPLGDCGEQIGDPRFATPIRRLQPPLRRRAQGNAPGLVDPERVNRVRPRGAPCRHKARDGANAEQHQGDEGDRGGIGWLDLEQQAPYRATDEHRQPLLAPPTLFAVEPPAAKDS